MKHRIFLTVMGMVLFFTSFGLNSLCLHEEFHSCSSFEPVFAQSNLNEEWIKKDVNTIKVNSNLQSSFSSFEQQIFENSNFVVGLILLMIIFLFLLSSHLILKRKKIQSRPYLLLIIAGILLFFGLPNLVASTLSLVINLVFQTNLNNSILVASLTSFGFASVLIMAAATILIKSKLIRQGLGYEQK